MNNPYNLCAVEGTYELAPDQELLHDILAQYSFGRDMDRLNSEILRSMLADETIRHQANQEHLLIGEMEKQ